MCKAPNGCWIVRLPAFLPGALGILRGNGTKVLKVKPEDLEPS